MKKSLKAAFITAALLIFSGLITVTLAAASIDFDFLRLNNTKLLPFEKVVEEPVTAVDIVSVSADVHILPSEDGRVFVSLLYPENIEEFDISVTESVLKISYNDKRKWYEKIGIYIGNSQPNIKLYLPAAEYKKLGVRTVSGDMSISDGFTFGEVDTVSTSGDITFLCDATVLNAQTTSGDVLVRGCDNSGIIANSTSGKIAVKDAKNCAGLSAKTTSGSILITDVSCEGLSLYTVSGDTNLRGVRAQELAAESTSGDTELEDIICTSHAKLRSVSGEIDFEAFDAKNITLKTTSGDIEGSLLSHKSFDTETASGNIRTPMSYGDAGLCSIKTTSGDVEIDYE